VDAEVVRDGEAGKAGQADAAAERHAVVGEEGVAHEPAVGVHRLVIVERVERFAQLLQDEAADVHAVVAGNVQRAVPEHLECDPPQAAGALEAHAQDARVAEGSVARAPVRARRVQQEDVLVQAADGARDQPGCRRHRRDEGIVWVRGDEVTLHFVRFQGSDEQRWLHSFQSKTTNDTTP